MGDLTGKVAIITGSGRGLGRAEALEFAKLGARVVVSEIDRPEAKEAAESVVEEIKGLGGEAIAAYGDCADTNDSQNLFKTAIDTFGDVNIMVNNAGFLRDKALFNMTDEEFDSVVRVHLRGHFVNMRNATAHWRAQAKAGGEVYGRLISTASEAFLFGSAGQPNYAAAKGGIVAMSMGAAQLMMKYGVTCNVICPRARTDMTDHGITAEIFAKPEEGFDFFAPENVSPLAGFLASPEGGNVSGEVFIVWGKRINVVQRPQLDVFYDNEDAWSVDNVGTTLGKHFEGRTPVTDGYSVPPQ